MTCRVPSGQPFGNPIRSARSATQVASIACLLPNSAYSSRLETWARVASFKVLAVNGKEAQVSVTTDGVTRQGTGYVYKNVIMFGQTQIATDDGQNGKVIYQVGTKSFMVPVTKYPPADSSSSVDKTA